MYTQVLEISQNASTFDASGEYLLLLKHNGGSWKLDILTPDDEDINVATFTGDTQQRLEVPGGTRLKLSGGTVGAKAWLGRIQRNVGDFL